jgi:hypothetical protein
MEINVFPESFFDSKMEKIYRHGTSNSRKCRKCFFYRDEALKFVGVMSHMAELCNKACPIDKAYNVMIQCMRDMETKVLAAIREDEGAKKTTQ